MTVKTAPKPISAKQISFIETLMAERKNGAMYVQTQIATYKNATCLADLTSKAASDIIGVLLNEPKATQAKVEAPKVTTIEPGFYIDANERIFQVVKSGNGNLYAKALEVTKIGTCGGCEQCDGENACQKSKGKFVYAPGAMKDSGSWAPLTKALAISTSKKFGSCCLCGRTLTKTESVEAGIGPICAGKVF